MKNLLSVRMKTVKTEKGFTLVELLATIVILGIIAAIAVPAIGNLIENTKQDAHEANAKQMVEAARLYVLTEGAPKNNKLSKKQLDGYLESIPQNPTTEKPYKSITVSLDSNQKISGVTLDGMSFDSDGKVIESSN
ncbi:type II secretion system protein [Pseudalkalibacillus sp. Hm43]|uniref:type II secretion system protein n=1 Tax=Pseudalkalibacillus sp. Hm43 TaxID=3450742 RepID=UPI003F4383E6